MFLETLHVERTPHGGAVLFARKSIRYTGSMWISIRSSKGQRSVEALAWCSLQGLGRSPISAVQLVNSDFTSKDIMILLSRIVSLLTVDTKWAELVTLCSEFPVNRKNNVNTKHSWLFVCIRFPRVASDCSTIKRLRDQYSDSRLKVVSLIIYFKTPDVTFLVF